MNAFESAFVSGGAFDALLSQFGVTVTHRSEGLGAGTEITVIFGTEAVAVGEYGERLERRYTAISRVTDGVQIGDTLDDGTRLYAVEQLTEPDGEDNIRRRHILAEIDQ